MATLLVWAFLPGRKLGESDFFNETILVRIATKNVKKIMAYK